MFSTSNFKGRFQSLHADDCRRLPPIVDNKNTRQIFLAIIQIRKVSLEHLQLHLTIVALNITVYNHAQSKDTGDFPSKDTDFSLVKR